MSFQFINTNASKRTPDERARRKIRSQVMKHYRRRNEGITGSASSLDSASASPASAVRSHSVSRQSSPALATPSSEVLGEHSATRGRPANLQRTRSTSYFLQTAHGLFANFTVDLPPEEPTSATPDRAEENRMLEICAMYSEWLGSQGPGMTALMTPASGTQASKLRLYGLTVHAIGHLHTIGKFQDENERAYYKARLLSLANDLLQDSSKALDDATLAALACLTSHEISFNSHEALTHLIGISHILAARGGFEGSNYDHGLPLILQGLDLSHALYFDSEPVLTTRTSLGRSLGEPVDTEDTHTAEDHVRKWQDTLREASSFLREQSDIEASRACYLAWRIYMFQPLSTSNESWSEQSIDKMNELFRLTKSMPSDAWNRYPALHARVILTAFATDTTHKSWYYTQLWRLILLTETQYWDDFISLIIRFLELQAYFKSPVLETVKAMVGGVEIVVEKALAQQVGLEIM